MACCRLGQRMQPDGAQCPRDLRPVDRHDLAERIGVPHLVDGAQHRVLGDDLVELPNPAGEHVPERIVGRHLPPGLVRAGPVLRRAGTEFAPSRRTTGPASCRAREPPQGRARARVWSRIGVVAAICSPFRARPPGVGRRPGARGTRPCGLKRAPPAPGSLIIHQATREQSREFRRARRADAGRDRFCCIARISCCGANVELWIWLYIGGHERNRNIHKDTSNMSHADYAPIQEGLLARVNTDAAGTGASASQGSREDCIQDPEGRAFSIARLAGRRVFWRLHVGVPGPPA